MTLLFIDGFDIYGANGAQVASVMTKGMWTNAAQVVQRTTNPAPRTGRACIRMGTAGGPKAEKLVTSTSTMIVGVGHMPDGVADIGNFLKLQHNTGSAVVDQVLVGRDLLNRLRIYNASSSAVLAQSSANAITLTDWQFVEIKVRMGRSNGEVVAHINELEVARASGVDTIKAGHSTLNQVGLIHDNSFAQGNVYDDFYICDDKGAVNNDFLGQIEVQTLLPNANGAVNDWTPVGASTNVSTVDEAVHDSDTTYVRASTLGDKDLYNVSSLAGGITNVFGVMPVAVVRKEIAGSNSLRLVTRVSTSEASSTVKTVDTTYGFISHVFETQPAGGSWTPAAVSAMQAGVTIVSTS